MLPEQLPPCICQQQTWDSSWADISPYMTSQWFICQSCGRPALLLSHVETVALLPTDPIPDFSEEMLDYINRVVVISLQAQRELFESSEKEEPLQQWIPPQLPAYLTAYVLTPEDGIAWQLVDRDISAGTMPAPDPVRARHDQAFNQIFARLEALLGKKTDREVVPNRYYGDRYNREPWYQFHLGNAKFVIGPRKRVTAIFIESEQPFDVRALFEQSVQRDNVSFWVDEDWHADRPTGKNLEVHAWTEDKAIEYIMLVAPQFLLVPA